MIWFVGACAALIFAAVSVLLIDWRFRDAVSRTDLIAIVGRKARVYVSSRTTGPLTYVVFRPCIILPLSIDGMDEDALEYMLLHELQHIRSRDVLINQLWRETKSYYYQPILSKMFNPFATGCWFCTRAKSYLTESLPTWLPKPPGMSVSLFLKSVKNAGVFSRYLVELRRLVLSKFAWGAAILSLCAPLLGYIAPLSNPNVMTGQFIANPVLSGTFYGAVIWALLALVELNRVHRAGAGMLIDAVTSPISMAWVRVAAIITFAVAVWLLCALIYLPYTVVQLGFLFSFRLLALVFLWPMTFPPLG